MKVVRQIIRGLGPLPHVGEHPGTMFLWVFWAFAGLGCLAGANHGLYAAMIGGLIMAAYMAPICLLGAYDRAEASDLISKNEALK